MDFTVHMNGFFFSYTIFGSILSRNSVSIIRPDFNHYRKLEGAARYAGLLLAPAEGFGLRPKGKKRAFYSILAHILVNFL